jgi:hypothetical protein
MKIEVTVNYNDGSKKDIDAVFADFVAFERTWNRSVSKLETELRLTDLAWLSWHSEKRRQQTALTFDPDWIGSVESIELREESDEDEVPVPLDKTQPTD